MNHRPLGAAAPTNFSELSELERREAIEALQADFGEARDDILMIESSEKRATMPEDIFFHVFLPFLSKVPQLEIRHMYFKDDPHRGGLTAREKMMICWMNVIMGNRDRARGGGREVASWVYAEIDIVNAQGEVVCTTPPIMSVEHINYGKDGRRASVWNIITAANAHAQRAQRYGDIFLREHLAQAAPSIVSDSAIIKNAVEWNKIFRKYNFPVIPNVPGDTDQPVETKVETKPAVINPNEFDDE